MVLLEVVPRGGVGELVAVLLQSYLYALGVTFSLSEFTLCVFIITFLRVFKHHPLHIKTFALLNLETIKRLLRY